MRRALLLLASVTALGMPAVADRAQAAPLARQASTDSYAVPVAEAAQRFGIPAAWIRAILRVESRGDRRAVSPKGAMGLMQLMPDTWAALRARYRLGRDAFDPHDNILAGAAFLREMHDRYGSPGFLAAYNAGPGRYEDYRDRHRPLPPETVAYVAALAPFVRDGAINGPVLVAALDPPSWTQAPLFITQSSSAEAADHSASRQPSGDTPAVVAVHDLSAIAPQSAGLFVPVSGAVPKR
jgi:membrane-bound lytic murein transglycosylase B